MSAHERADCLTCGKGYPVTSAGRLYKHKAAHGPGVCRGSGRPTNRLLDERDARIDALEQQVNDLTQRLDAVERMHDMLDAFADLTAQPTPRVH